VTIPGNVKLAMEPETGKPTSDVLIETRGEGGYILTPGGAPEARQAGRPQQAPVLVDRSPGHGRCSPGVKTTGGAVAPGLLCCPAHHPV
jgi:hypothetical protein